MTVKLDFVTHTKPSDAAQISADLDEINPPSVSTLAARYLDALGKRDAAHQAYRTAEQSLIDAERGVCESAGPNAAVVCGSRVLHIRDEYWDIGVGIRISVLAVAG